MIKKRVAFHTLGCRLNQHETDSLASDFFKGGYEIVESEEDADVHVINTCTVTNRSDQKSRNTINHVCRTKDDALVVVTGCFAVSNREYLEKKRGITYVVDNARKSQIFHLVDAHFKGEILHPNSLDRDLFKFCAAEKSFHTRSMIKIQDGCDNFCSFCIVPLVRGRATSRPPEDILENVRHVMDFGYKEVVLTGVNMGRYRDNEIDFSGLIEKILSLPGNFRVRLSSIEPEPLGDRFIDLLSHPKMCPHLHLCLQSGSERILLLMRRQYNLGEYLSLVSRIRARYPDFNLTTDIIVGFPGETGDDFGATCRIVREVGFSHVHTFKYSKRDGTRAARMPDQVPEKIKNERSEIIRRISRENKYRYRKGLVGKEQTVLVEKVFEGAEAKGYGEHYVPVRFKLDNRCVEGALNSFHTVRITEIGHGEDPALRGVPV